MRLIDADALKNELIECTPYAIDPVYRNTNSNIDVFTVMEMLDGLPTIDAVRVVRGECLNFVGDFSIAECDKCGFAPTMHTYKREHLAAVFLKAVERFYKDPENQRAFEEWLAKEGKAV